jgi:phosphonate degradation associated HDIG domain protein
MKEAGSREDLSTPDGRGWSLSAWCVVAAFGTYFCTYAFRKPFTAAGYADVVVWGLGYKTVLVTAQVLGYTLAKFVGIKVVAEVRPHQRAGLLLGLIAAAAAALFLFGLTPIPFNLLWLFCNGLALGMGFGLVLGFLEGRLHTEALAAGLCSSFIVADGVTKSVGAGLLKAGVSEYWMPLVAGLLFVPPLLLFTWMLTRIPGPSPRDVAARSRRTPMDKAQRWAFFRRYAPGVTLLVLVYLLVTILRSVRADFAPEIWAGLQGTVPPTVFAWSETAVAAGVLVMSGAAVLIGDNRRAFFFGMASSFAGAALVGVALLGLQAGGLSPFVFMVLHGIGLYLPYLAVQTTIFERLFAMTHDRGTIGYLMYLADSVGYLGYVGVLLVRNALDPPANFLAFFLPLSWVIAGGCLVLLIPCWRYFANLPATRQAPTLKGSEMTEVIDRLITLFREKGQGTYFGEAVTETEHALQCAHLAEQSGAAPELIAAALLHDVGHLLHGLPEDIATQGIDGRHEEAGAAWLGRYFGPAVVEPVRLHVAAKRYLCAVEPDYHAGLSKASQHSLGLQGGPMSAAEVARFEQEPWFRSAALVRRWDDAAKVPGLAVSGLDHYRPCLEAVLRRLEGP